MPPPLSLISLAMAAGGGTVNGIEVRQLVAAGVTMLQRCAPLVRTLAGARGALLLGSASDSVVALAACEGHGAVLLDPAWSAERIGAALEASGARVVFTRAEYAAGVPSGVALLSLDELPGHVRFSHGAMERRIDVGSHFGLTIEGEASEGSDEIAVVEIATDANGASEPRACTHRALLSAARAVALGVAIRENDVVSCLASLHDAAGIAAGLVAPAIAGARTLTMDGSNIQATIRALHAGGCTVIVSDARCIESIAHELIREGDSRTLAPLRAAVVVGQSPPAESAELWERATGATLLHAPLPPHEAHSL